MLEQVSTVYQRIEDVRPLVRPTYNQFEVDMLPPYGNPEVHIPGEVGTYVAVGVLLGSVTGLLDAE